MTPDRWQTLERLFHRALGCDPDRRSILIEAQCAGDAALKREVEALLDHALASSGFLEHPALYEAAEQLAADERAAPIAAQVPGYAVLRTLGEGGMGVVYLAEQEGPIRRQVALKLIKPGMDTRQVIARFEAERQALALMRHPGIATVFDAGTTEAGGPYFAMEYVNGVPITKYADRHRLTIGARLRLFLDVCGAVEHAHQKGIIHRDLKPSNVLVTDEGNRPVVKVIDFGVAKATAPTLGSGTAVTEQGVVVGTPEYMSPEQAALLPDIDTATDVYALGVLLYELLAGVLPFDPQALRAAGYDGMRRIVCDQDPPRPSVRLTGSGPAADAAASARQTDARRLSRQLRGDLDWIVLKALEKDRRRRYTTVVAFADDVARYLAARPVVARPVSMSYRLGKFSRRHRGAVVGATAASLALVAGLAAGIAQYRSVLQARRDADFAAYVASIGAADAELRLHRTAEARRRLLAVPAGERGWEWDHLWLKSDTSLVTLTSEVPTCRERPLSEKALSFAGGDDRIFFRRCGILETWGGADYAHAVLPAPGPVLAVAPGGAMLAVTQVGSGTDGPWDLRLIDAAGNLEVGRFGPFQTEPVCAEIANDGTRLAVGLKPRVDARALQGDQFEIWDVRTEHRLVRLLPPMPPHEDARTLAFVTCDVTFSPDGRRLASSGKQVHVWSATSGRMVATDAVPTGAFSQPVAWSPDGARLAIGRLTGLVELLDPSTPGRTEPLDGDGRVRPPFRERTDRQHVTLTRSWSTPAVLAIAFSPDGRWIMTGEGVNVGVWDLSAKRLAHVLLGHTDSLVGVAVDHTGRVLSADTEGRVKVWRLADAGAMTILPGTYASGPRMDQRALSANGSILGIGNHDGSLYAWRLADSRRIVLRPGGQSTARRVTGLAVSPDGRRLVAGEPGNGGPVRTWDLVSGQITTMLLLERPEPGCELTDPRDSVVGSMAVSPDGSSLAFRQGGCLIVLDLAAEQVLAVLRRFPNWFQFRPDGSLLVTAYDASRSPESAKVLVWDWRTDTVRAEVALDKEPPHGNWEALTSVDGRYVAIRGGRGALPASASVAIWDGDLRRELGRLPVSPDTLFVALSADGRRIATTAREDNTVRIWDVERQQLLLSLADEERSGTGLAFTSDGRLVSRQVSGDVVIWETRSPGLRSASR